MSRTSRFAATTSAARSHAARSPGSRRPSSCSITGSASTRHDHGRAGHRPLPGRPPKPLTSAQEFRLVADKHPDRPALMTPEETLTYAELDERTDRVAIGLRELGLEP